VPDVNKASENTMNPLTNRWAAALMVAAVLLVVSELVGTDEQGGVLSQAAGTSLPDGVVQGDAVPIVVSPVTGGDETPQEDMPQVIAADSPDIVDASEPIEGSDGEPDVIEDAGVDEFVDDSGE
jgi:hypothetical protein